MLELAKLWKELNLSEYMIVMVMLIFICNLCFNIFIKTNVELIYCILKINSLINNMGSFQ